MKLTIQRTQRNDEIEISYLSKKDIDKQIEREMFIQLGLELSKHLTILQSYEQKSFNQWRYAGQCIVLSMNSFHTIMQRLEQALPYTEYLVLREVFNEKI